MSDRIRMIRAAQTPKMSQEEFGAKAGITRNMIGNFENGRSEPSETCMRMLCHVYHVNYNWLSGDESADMFVTSNDDDRRVQDLLSGDNDFAKRVLHGLSRLSADEWAVLQKIVGEISQPGEQR